MEKGIKKKISIFTKQHSSGFYGKASQLMSSLWRTNRYISDSFGHSSVVDSVLPAFLAGKHHFPTPIPSENKQMREDVGTCLIRKDLELGFWLDDESLENLKKKDVDSQNQTQLLTQTLNLQFSSAISTSDNNCLKTDRERDSETSFESCLSDEVEEFATTQDLYETLNLPDDCINEFVIKNALEDDDESEEFYEKLCNNGDMAIDKHIDFAKAFESFIADGVFESNQEFAELASSLLIDVEDIDEDYSMDPNLFFDSEAIGNRALDKDDLCFSDDVLNC